MWTSAEYNLLRRAIKESPCPSLKLAQVFWPQVYFYDKEREMFQSVEDNDETVVAAANKMGKDFTAGAIALTRSIIGAFDGGCRVVTTSVKDDHLRVLWGEIGRFVQTSAVPLRVEEGGPLVVNHRDIRFVVGGKVCQISYLRGMVSERGEGMAGHHARHTLGVIDEGSGVDDFVYTQMCTWAKKLLIFGNCNACSNFFFKAVEGGDILAV